MEEGGPPGPKVFRLLYFVGAGFICTFAINKWRAIERNSILKQQQMNRQVDRGLSQQTPADSVPKTP